GQPRSALTLPKAVRPGCQGINLGRQYLWPRQRAVQRSGGTMQQFGTATKAVTHGLTVRNRDRGQLDQAWRLHFVGQSPDDVPDSFFNRDLPSIAQRRSNGFD